ncbi:MAG: hypothetical protein HC848_00735 [Limnobacter sp.]|nr:hypothetical protein [Limnobacter sp.]
MQSCQLDFTRFFRSLASLAPLENVHTNWQLWQNSAFFPVQSHEENKLTDCKNWLIEYVKVVGAHFAPSTNAQTQTTAWQAALKAHNPCVVPRNHLLQTAIEGATHGNCTELNRLLQAVSDPYTEQAECANLYNAAPPWARHLEVSCSS